MSREGKNIGNGRLSGVYEYIFTFVLSQHYKLLDIFLSITILFLDWFRFNLVYGFSLQITITYTHIQSIFRVNSNASRNRKVWLGAMKWVRENKWHEYDMVLKQMRKKNTTTKIISLFHQWLIENGGNVLIENQDQIRTFTNKWDKWV